MMVPKKPTVIPTARAALNANIKLFFNAGLIGLRLSCFFIRCIKLYGSRTIYVKENTKDIGEYKKLRDLLRFSG